jgi:hypothetical protein
MKFSYLWTRPVVSPTTAPKALNDSTVERLRGLQREHQDASRRLAQHRAEWDRLKPRADP